MYFRVYYGLSLYAYAINLFETLQSYNREIFSRIVSAIQASLSCIAGFMVCSSSCKKSFLTASHYMSDAYAWFGCAYFLYDMWSMYAVYVQKIADKLKIIKDDAINENVPIMLNGNSDEAGMYDKLNISNGDDGYHSNGSVTGQSVEQQAKHEEHMYVVRRLQKVPIETPSFIYYCLTNPVMTIHHVFLGSFGLFVIVVCARGYLGDNAKPILT